MLLISTGHCKSGLLHLFLVLLVVLYRSLSVNVVLLSMLSHLAALLFRMR